MKMMEVLWNGELCGKLTAEKTGLYVVYRATCRMDRNVGPMRLFAVGEKGELRLGVMQPENGCFVLRKQLSLRESKAAGKLLRGELRKFAPVESGWKPIGETELCFCDPLLQKRLCELGGGMVCRGEKGCFLALPLAVDRPFPFVELFCFAHVRKICGREYVVFGFDTDNNPTFF